MGEIFPDLPKIKYEGKESGNLLSFKYYNQEQKIRGKKMRDILRFDEGYFKICCSILAYILP